VAVVREGEIIYCRRGRRIRRDLARFLRVVLERKRREEEQDRFTWYCEKCGTQLHQSVKHVGDYRRTPSPAPTRSSTGARPPHLWKVPARDARPPAKA